MKSLIWWSGLTSVLLVSFVFIGQYVNRFNAVKHPDLRADPSNYQFVDASGKGDQVEITFRLVNNGLAAVTITKLERSCSCSGGTDLEGQVIEPGGVYDLRVFTRVPANGVNKDTLWIHHNGGSPLQLTADIVGRKDVPHIVGSMPTANFFGLDSKTSPIVVKVVTCESAGSQPWLDGARSTLPLMKVETIEMTERAANNLVVREYHLRLSWLGLPTSNDFSGAVVPKLNSVEHEAENIKFVSIVGTLARRQSDSEKRE